MKDTILGLRAFVLSFLLGLPAAGQKIEDLTDIGTGFATGDLGLTVDISEPLAANQSKKFTVGNLWTWYQTQAATFSHANGVSITGGDLVLTERADHASTPGAGFGYLWVKSDVPSSLYFTADDGTDYDLTAASGGLTNWEENVNDLRPTVADAGQLGDATKGVNSVHFGDPGDADGDQTLLSVNVTGTPTLSWDESEDSFSLSKPLTFNQSNLNITTGGSTGQLRAGTTGVLGWFINHVKVEGVSRLGFTSGSILNPMDTILHRAGAGDLAIWAAAADTDGGTLSIYGGEGSLTDVTAGEPALYERMKLWVDATGQGNIALQDDGATGDIGNLRIEVGNVNYLEVKQNDSTDLLRLTHTGAQGEIVTNLDNLVLKSHVNNQVVVNNTLYVADSGTNSRVGAGVSSPDTRLDVAGALTLRELSADPANPDEGSFAIWQDDGGGSGDDGDIMLKVTAAASTNLLTLYDKSNDSISRGVRSEFVPIGWSNDGAVPPGLLETFSDTRKVDIRKFASDVTEDVELFWQIPEDAVDADTGTANWQLKYRVIWIVTEASGPSTTGCVFNLEGVPIADNEDIGAATLGAVAISDDIDETAVQNDLMYSDWAEVTLVGAVAGEGVFFKFQRDHDDVDDDYLQDVGVVGLEFKFKYQSAAY